MAFLVVTVARKPQTTQMRHGKRLGRAPSKEGAGLYFAVGGISNANNSRMPAPTCFFLRPFLKALQLTGPPPAAFPLVVGAAAARGGARRARRRF